MPDYFKFEKKVDEIRNQNNVLLGDFEKWLNSKKLSDKTIIKHVQNVDFFINSYLTYYEPVHAYEGVEKVSEYLGDWFIRKSLWSNKTSILSNIASLKKFYQYMLEIKKITKEDLIFLNDTIQEEKEYWIEAVEIYNDF